MEEKYQGDFFETSENVGIDLNEIVGLKFRGNSIQIFRQVKQESYIVSTIISDEVDKNSFLYSMAQKYGYAGVDILVDAGKYMDIK